MRYNGLLALQLPYPLTGMLDLLGVPGRSKRQKLVRARSPSSQRTRRSRGRNHLFCRERRVGDLPPGLALAWRADSVPVAVVRPSSSICQTNCRKNRSYLPPFVPFKPTGFLNRLLALQLSQPLTGMLDWLGVPGRSERQKLVRYRSPSSQRTRRSVSD